MARHTIQGKVKMFKAEAGYGFITVPGRNADVYFNASAVQDEPPPSRGDAVVFCESLDSMGRKHADLVKIVYRARTRDGRPNHGRPTKFKDRTETNEYDGARNGGMYGIIFGPWGVLIGALIGQALHQEKCQGNYKTWTVEGELLSLVCGRCNATMHVTTILPERIGFQCERCGWYENSENVRRILPDQVELAVPKLAPDT